MKKYLRFDSVGGASGDMILSALVSLGADLQAIEKTLNSFFPEKLHLHCALASDFGLNGLRLKVQRPASGVLDPGSEVLSPESTHWPDAHHTHAHHHHDHHHRGLREIEALLQGSPLSEATRNLASEVFRSLAAAEAKIHNTTPEAVHFHEVGAWDSVADIVGSCLALEQLGICGVSCGPLPAGIGTLSCSHGQMPNPAPASQELLQGMRVVQTDEPYELVTPTGAALLRVWTQTLERVPEETVIEKSGFGFGTRKLNHRPNVLRATIMGEGETQGPKDARTQVQEKLLVMEANLDDCNSEWIASLIPVLLEQGALDVWQTPILMKKGRAGVLLSVLAPETCADALRETIFRGTTTFGIRYYPVQREVLERCFEQVATPYGEVPVKVGLYKGEAITRSPEHDACEALAKAHGVTVKQVWPK
jgi:pyridinium-3,5-bisthiocarboxylic acid mononucleotide nickel chelatase